MTFKDDLENDLNDVFFNENEFAVGAVYIAKEPQQQYAISVIIDEINDPNESGNAISAQAEIWIKTFDIPNPKHLDEVVIDSVTWRVERKLREIAGTAILLVRRLETVKL